MTSDLDEIGDDELAGGMVAWTTFDSPWAHLTDRARFEDQLDALRRLQPARILSGHLPPALGRLDRFLDIVASVPGAAPFVAPGAAAFDQIVAELARTGR